LNFFIQIYKKHLLLIVYDNRLKNRHEITALFDLMGMAKFFVLRQNDNHLDMGGFFNYAAFDFAQATIGSNYALFIVA